MFSRPPTLDFWQTCMRLDDCALTVCGCHMHQLLQTSRWPDRLLLDLQDVMIDYLEGYRCQPKPVNAIACRSPCGVCILYV